MFVSQDPVAIDSVGADFLMNEPTVTNPNGSLGKEYLKGKIVERDITKAVEYLTQSAEAGNQYAQYALGKLYLDIQNQEQAHYWFTQSAAQGNEYAQFFLDRWDNLKPPSVMLSVTRLLHHIRGSFLSIPLTRWSRLR